MFFQLPFSLSFDFNNDNWFLCFIIYHYFCLRIYTSLSKVAICIMTDIFILSWHVFILIYFYWTLWKSLCTSWLYAIRGSQAQVKWCIQSQNCRAVTATWNNNKKDSIANKSKWNCEIQQELKIDSRPI